MSAFADSSDFARSDVKFVVEPVERLDALLEPAAQWNVFDFVRVVRALPEGAVVAGGCFASLLTGQKPKDIDVYFLGGDTGVDGSIVGKLLHKLGYSLAAQSPAGCIDFEKKGSVRVQLIVGVRYDDPAHVLDGFDLTVCQMACDRTSFYRHPNALEDIAARRVVVHRVRSAKRTFCHLARYVEKGFFPSPEVAHDVAAQILEQEAARRLRAS